ncbi:MAG: hypothetical protein RL632_1337, partial [Bacteroidota bacterium]
IAFLNEKDSNGRSDDTVPADQNRG